jgi:tetratricopeptide (TPR) repeat protein
LIADWFAVAGEQGAVDRGQEAPTHIADHYARAAELGLTLEPLQHDRWADALLAQDKVAEARRQLAELNAQDLRDESQSVVRPYRNRVFRKIIEHALRHGDLNDEGTAELLDEFRADARLSAADRAWALARQVELLLGRGLAQQAVDQLLVDLRRLHDGDDAPSDGDSVGELYLLLARGYGDLNRLDDCEYFIERADATLPASSIVRAELLLQRSRLALERAELEQAEQWLTEIIDHYAESHVLPLAIFARAETRSRLGGHEASRQDFELLRPMLNGSGVGRGVTLAQVARSLIDRHDAVLTTGRLEDALQYIKLAESLYAPADVPAELLSRLAATHRQIADNMLAEGTDRFGAPTASLADITPEVRYEAGRHHDHAATYFVRHARAIAGLPNEEDAWAHSLWLAGESHDLAGRPDQAAEIFREYLASRSTDDPQRPEVLFRLAQAQQSLLEYAAAAETYAQLIDEHPRSPQATRSHVPLAECLVVTDRRAEAVERLRAVLAGEHPITPDAVDYRDALLALGRIQYEAGEYASAISSLQQAVDRYPDDELLPATQFTLGDAHRRMATAIEQSLESATDLTPSQRSSLTAERERSLRSAGATFDAVLATSESKMISRDPAVAANIRHALLYRGDCAYRLGDFERAIAYFDRYARQYGDHHSSLTALIQIVNCYEELGQSQQASRAHERALFRLSQLPDQAFAEPDALMDRAAWERWMRNRPIGMQASATSEGGG